jgi:hypothetical protein
VFKSKYHEEDDCEDFQLSKLMILLNITTLIIIVMYTFIIS